MAELKNRPERDPLGWVSIEVAIATEFDVPIFSILLYLSTLRKPQKYCILNLVRALAPNTAPGDEAMNAAEAVIRARLVKRPGFLIVWIFLSLKRDSSGRIKLGRVAMPWLASLAENIVTYQKLEVAFSDLLTDDQIDRGMDTIRAALEDWELSEEERFQARGDILGIKSTLEDILPTMVDNQGRILLSELQSVINDLWKKAVEQPQEPPTTPK